MKSAYHISEIYESLIYNLPGVIVNTLDGGLTAAFAPQDDSILVIGTAGEGVVNTPYQVTDRALAAAEFGFSGTLERGIEECATNSDNIIAFRCGTNRWFSPVWVSTPPSVLLLPVSPSPSVMSPPMQAPAIRSGTKSEF
jgi:hypothetical protein